MRYVTLALTMMLGAGLVVACDDEIASERNVDVQNDRVVTEETTVEETPGGDIEVTEERSVEPIEVD